MAVIDIGNKMNSLRDFLIADNDSSEGESISLPNEPANPIDGVVGDFINDINDGTGLDTNYSSSIPEFIDTSTSNDVLANLNNPQGSDLKTLSDYINSLMQDSAFTANSTQKAWLNAVMQYNAAQAEIDRQFQQTSADKAMEFSAAEAEKNRQWQEALSNTSYRRAMDDLKAAGLNPKLVAQLAGASTPSGGYSPGVSASGRSASSSVPSSHAAEVSDSVVNALSGVFTALQNAENVDKTNLTNIFRSVIGLFDIF